MPPLQALTRVAEDYLKAIWSAQEWGGDPVTAKQLADRFGITAATVSVTLKRLAGQGLLVHEAYGPIELTADGSRHAIAVVRRHRLLETFLVEVLHYDWAEVHEEAEELEHATSDRLIERIAAALGNPVADPHGDPIPSPDGRIQRPAEVRTLDRAAAGRYRITRVSDADPAVLERMAQRGLRPPRLLNVLQHRQHDVLVALADDQTAVPIEDAASILLEPLP
ncbi:metal-dependent transcriptional regulator, partial [Jatrophihabitans endophyticus]|uniref:metal-dependent transcriptional regulator n=1 Tax=Jatrophihabitans endophyticus TaxID=1206085 RepID=UPI0019DF6B36